MDETQAEALRQLAKDVSKAVEARIAGEAGAVELIRRSTQKLQAVGMGPFEYWGVKGGQPLENVCFIMAQEMGVLPCLNKSDREITADQIASELGADSLLIARIMRVLTCAGVGEETAPNTYKPNDISAIAASLGGQAEVKIKNELLFPIASRLVPYMREHGFKQFPQRPTEMDPTQFTYGGKMMFEYLKDTPDMKQWFDTLMAENRKGNKPWFTIYPFVEELGAQCSSKPNGVSLVDVGGNRGADILEFRKTYPDFPGRLVLQDLPETIAQIDKSIMQDVELQTYDFFTPQPVEKATAYFWRWIVHDWDDEQTRKFLSNTVKVMDKDSRLLLEEFVLPDMGCDAKTSHLDILMMLYHSGLERTRSQWISLLESCGLTVVKIWTRPDTDSSVIECKLQQ